jgi:hypothetical protein
MRIIIVPSFAALTIKVNPSGELKKISIFSFEPGLCAPRPEAKEKGCFEIEMEDRTLRAVLRKIAELCRQADADFEPLCFKTNDVSFDYDVFPNRRNYVSLPSGLDTEISDGDGIKVKADVIGHC